jgi:hypothetical protein
MLDEWLSKFAAEYKTNKVTKALRALVSFSARRLSSVPKAQGQPFFVETRDKAVLGAGGGGRVGAGE